MDEDNLDLSKPCIITTTARPKNIRSILERKLGRKLRPEFFACHACNNECCREPLHLYEGTSSQNLVDSYLAGRFTFNADKTHCPEGHEYSDSNTYIWRGERQCKICKREGFRRWYKKHGRWRGKTTGLRRRKRPT
jgi:hypothetical protein